MLLIWYKFRHIKHNNTILCKHFSIKSLCAFNTCWWYNKMAYNVKSLYFTLHWCAICFSNRHFILVHLITFEILRNYRVSGVCSKSTRCFLHYRILKWFKLIEISLWYRRNPVSISNDSALFPIFRLTFSDSILPSILLLSISSL